MTTFQKTVFGVAFALAWTIGYSAGIVVGWSIWA